MRYATFSDLIASPNFALPVATFERTHACEVTALVLNLALQQFDRADAIIQEDSTLKPNLDEDRQQSGGFVRALQGLSVQLGSTSMLNWLEGHGLRVATREMSTEPSSMHPIVLAVEADNREMLMWYRSQEGAEAFTAELPGKTSAIAKASVDPGLFLWMLELEPQLLDAPFHAKGHGLDNPMTIDEYVASEGATGLADQLRSFRAARSALDVLNELTLTQGVRP